PDRAMIQILENGHAVPNERHHADQPGQREHPTSAAELEHALRAGFGLCGGGRFGRGAHGRPFESTGEAVCAAAGAVIGAVTDARAGACTATPCVAALGSRGAGLRLCGRRSSMTRPNSSGRYTTLTTNMPRVVRTLIRLTIRMPNARNAS